MTMINDLIYNQLKLIILFSLNRKIKQNLLNLFNLMWILKQIEQFYEDFPTKNFDLHGDSNR